MYKKNILTMALLIFAGNLFGQTGLEIIVEENNNGLTITKSKGTAKTLIIPETIDDKPVTVIGEGAFSGKG
jgi:hypothetical protein